MIILNIMKKYYLIKQVKLSLKIYLWKSPIIQEISQYVLTFLHKSDCFLSKDINNILKQDTGVF